MWNDKVRQTLNLVFAIAQPVIAMLTNLGITGPSIGELSNRYPTYVAPAGYAFVIWNFIFVLSVGYGIWQALPSQRESNLLRQVGWWTAPALAATSLWMLLFQRSLFLLSLMVMLSLLISLIGVAMRLINYARGFSLSEQWLVHINFSVFLGWITVATVANIGQVLTAYEWSGWGVDFETWGILVLLAAGLIASGVTVALKGNIPYALTVIWGLLGVMINQFTRTVPPPSIMVGIFAAAVAFQLGFTLWFTCQKPYTTRFSRHNSPLRLRM